MQSKRPILTTKFYETLFNQFSSSYRYIDYISLGTTNIFRHILLKQIKSNVNQNLLDIMCGDGNCLSMLNKQTNYTGIDISSKMIHLAKQKSKASKHQFLQADIYNLPSFKSKFNIIIHTFGLKCIPKKDYAKFAEVIDYQLAFDGQFLFTEFQLPNNKLVKTIVQLYLNCIVAPLLYLLTNSDKTYSGLITSLEKNIDLEKFENCFHQQGLSIRYKKYFFGTFLIGRGFR